MMASRSILALDYGTTALKAVLYDGNLQPLAKAQREWSYLYPRPGHIEMDPELYWIKTVEAIREIFGQAGGAEQLSAVSVTGQSETLICLDEQGQSIGNAIVWLDTRPRQECEEFSRAIPAADLYRKTGNTGFDPVMPILKLKWMQRHEPDRFRNTRWFLLLKEKAKIRAANKQAAKTAKAAEESRKQAEEAKKKLEEPKQEVSV